MSSFEKGQKIRVDATVIGTDGPYVHLDIMGVRRSYSMSHLSKAGAEVVGESGAGTAETESNVQTAADVNTTIAGVEPGESTLTVGESVTGAAPAVEAGSKKGSKAKFI